MLHAMGWRTEYRQLEPGKFSSTFTTLEDEHWFLMEEQSNRTVEVEAPAPDGMYALAIVDDRQGSYNGHFLSPEHICIQGPDSSLRATLPTGIKVSQMGISTEMFEELVDAVAPGLSISRDDGKSIAITPTQSAALRHAMRAALLTPAGRKAMRDEAVSHIATSMVTAMARHARKPFGRRLHRPAARVALDRAREYIEANLERKILVESLCDYAGTNLRSLERTFAREMGMTPQQYVKIRRLNAVRNSLLASDREQGHSVTSVALGHGFTHLGRFAGDYRRLFGEPPKDTLLRP